MKIEMQILKEIEGFCVNTGISECQFGLATVRNHKLTKRIREGRAINSNTINAIRTYIAENKTEKTSTTP